ncbi:hypothetical protein [Lacticaseibacillus paracasei]|jgi:hypothetical protein|uniref:hypothetical protein n=1 Tax=Lacticaseibacillus paracasei TaxID=1597 RepID=UPI0003A48071|nr:hypothetical protein [Lacticaseibacillus paracasei]AUC02208.1 hypothetical protein BBD24_14635 [Lacticaseibacillus paracasei subsp. paracasei]MDH7443877.1 hypothetical protein [Lacticaseibacillus paracasei subsp. paracasei]MEA0973833.1 hypothetical protein [Lacticaseibacillus paracasei]
MARGNNKDGFSIDSIVKTNPVVSSPDQKKRTTSVHATANTLETLIQKKSNSKVAKMLYLERDVSKTLDVYGKKIGKANGGASRIVNEALKEYFGNHQLK